MNDRLHPHPRGRLVAATGDGRVVFRTARSGRAHATVFVGAKPRRTATDIDTNITLFVELDGAWSLVGQTFGPDELHLLASGHVDDLPKSPVASVVTPPQTGRHPLHRLIVAVGDGSAVFRTARNDNPATATVYAADGDVQATGTDRSISLAVGPDGAWSLVGQDSSHGEVIALASGHVDEMTATPEGEVSS